MSALATMTKAKTQKTSTTNVQKFVEQLVAADRELLGQNRRSEKRHSFAYPVTICLGRDETHMIPAFSRDISPQGIGLLHRNNLADGRVGTLTIHLPDKPPVSIRAESRWSKPYGDGWFITGWRLIAVEQNGRH